MGRAETDRGSFIAALRQVICGLGVDGGWQGLERPLCLSGTWWSVMPVFYSKRMAVGAVILRSSGSVSVLTAKATASPMPMIV